LLVSPITGIGTCGCRKSQATGGAAEVFLLDPIEPEKNPTLALQRGSPAIWNVLIGGKRISTGDRLRCTHLPLEAHVLEREQKSAKVRLEWSPSSAPLSEVLEHVGKLPLPPYMKREASSEDLSRYQTVYARAAGSVAAPTAGLHFSEEVNARLAARDIQRAQCREGMRALVLRQGNQGLPKLNVTRQFDHSYLAIRMSEFREEHRVFHR
jgi:S-adenosylmethionine:tRNA ribosyltransferase-isomerase